MSSRRPMRPCRRCGTPHRGSLCTNSSCSLSVPRASAHARGYDRQHQVATAQAIAAEPWCHRAGGCPYDDAGTPANPLTGDHPLTLAQCGGDKARWEAQERVPLCRRCNTSKGSGE